MNKLTAAALVAVIALTGCTPEEIQRAADKGVDSIERVVPTRERLCSIGHMRCRRSLPQAD